MGYCLFCAHRDNTKPNEDKECPCDLLDRYVAAMSTCPGWKAVEKTEEEKAEAEKILTMGKTDPL